MCIKSDKDFYEILNFLNQSGCFYQCPCVYPSSFLYNMTSLYEAAISLDQAQHQGSLASCL